MSAKLCQIIAVVNGQKSRTTAEVTKWHKMTQKPELLKGISRVYTPKDDDGDAYPPESQKVQLTAETAIEKASKSFIKLFDVVATQDAANCEAKADVKVGDTVVLQQVPVTTLLFLEKQLHDIHKFVDIIPELPSSVDWKYDVNKGFHQTDAIVANKTKKIQKPVVLAPATKEHPAQVQLVGEDIIVGTWATTHFSGALPADEKRAMLKRIVELQDGVKFAREEANGREVVDVELGQKLFDYITTK